VLRHRRVQGQGEQRRVRKEPSDLERYDHRPSVLSDIGLFRCVRGRVRRMRNGEESSTKPLPGFGDEGCLRDERKHRRAHDVADEDS
jgi:hypothetical protein